MNISSLTLDEVRDRLAELSGWIYDHESHSWSKDGKETRWDLHPIDFTLDEAAKLPDGYRVERRNCRTMNRWCYDVWKKLPDGNWTCITIQLAEAGYLEYAPCIDTGDEKADRFPIRLACELAEKEAT